MVFFICVFVFSVSVDQISKYIFLNRFPELVYYNSTIAFSLPISWYIPWVVILVFLAGLMFFRQAGTVNTNLLSFNSMINSDQLLALSIGLIAGGGVGNLIDRFLHDGRVVDFIDVKIWPVFNIADVAIVSGVLLFLFRSYIKRRVSSKL